MRKGSSRIPVSTGARQLSRRRRRRIFLSWSGDHVTLSCGCKLRWRGMWTLTYRNILSEWAPLRESLKWIWLDSDVGSNWYRIFQEWPTFFPENYFFFCQKMRKALVIRVSNQSAGCITLIQVMLKGQGESLLGWATGEDSASWWGCGHVLCTTPASSQGSSLFSFLIRPFSASRYLIDPFFFSRWLASVSVFPIRQKRSIYFRRSAPYPASPSLFNRKGGVSNKLLPPLPTHHPDSYPTLQRSSPTTSTDSTPSRVLN